MTIASVYALFADRAEAERIGRAMVEERLAACVNILGPVQSIYRWRGAVEQADEVAAIFKTGADKITALIDRIAALHSYETPCLTAWPVEQALGAYAAWVEDSIA